MKRRTKAQSIVEYLLVFGGIVLAVLIGAKVMADKAKTQMDTSGLVVNRGSSKTIDKLGLESGDFDESNVYTEITTPTTSTTEP